MNPYSRYTTPAARLVLASALLIGLQACGGSDSGSTTQNIPDPTPATTPPPATPAPAPAPAPAPSRSAAPGGFIESPALASPRRRLAQNEVEAFLPERGPFTFPAPYETRGARISNSSDCGGDNDCIAPVGYSYWRNMNNHVHDDEILIFLRADPARGGEGPLLYSYNKKNEKVTKRGPLFDASSKFRNHTGEGWYFSAQMPNTLYIRDGGEMIRYDVVTKTFETVFDATDRFGDGHIIWQMHSSNDDRVHSATVRRSSDWQELGCMVFNEDTQKYTYFERSGKGAYDECQIDKSGRYLVIKDQMTGNYGVDNRIIDLKDGSERLLIDEDGAGGHSDNGYGSMVAADDWADKPNAWKVWDFTKPTLEGRLVYYNSHWSPMAPSHVSFSNARKDVPLEKQYACGGSASATDDVHTNEIVCFMLDGSDEALVVAPVMTDQTAPGGGEMYHRMPKGNLDVTGQYFLWTSNMGGNRLDAFLVKVPAQKLTDR